MNTVQINAALGDAFVDSRIVFWNDPKGEFAQAVTDLDLPEVEIVDLAEVGGLEIKSRLEHQEPERRFLLYSAAEEPDYSAAEVPGYDED